MNTRKIVAATLLSGITLASGIAATAASDTGAARRAATEYKSASKALGKQKVAKAIASAEAAVALDPRHAGYRTLLGQAYLAAGRFPSAVGALSDALSLDPTNGTAALHLSLAQIATGDWGAARETLRSHEGSIPASDRGLAFALAGDPATAVAVLTAAAREPGADAKTRQNLGLSLALAGRWIEAKTVASLDMAPAEVDARIMHWAAFAKPTGAADQVAALLGVVPIVDGGQPQRLALNSSTSHVAAVVQPIAPVETFMPTEVATAPAPTVERAPSVGTADVSNIASAIVFADREEVVQAAPVSIASSTEIAPPLAKPRSARLRSAIVTPGVAKRVTPSAARQMSKGTFYVQLGAYQNAGVAKDAWGRMTRRVNKLGKYAPQGTEFNARGQKFYRLSVGGFVRGDADTLCRRIRVGGGKCFVRTGAGDRIAAWSVDKDVRFAMRNAYTPLRKGAPSRG